MKILLTLLLSIALSACLTSNDVRMSSEHAQFIEKVGVISVLDEHANIHYAAQEPKDIIDRRAHIEGWQINRVVGQHIVERMAQKGFKARLLNIDEQALAPYDNSWARPNTEMLRPKLYEIGAAAGVDMLVVVYRQRVSEFISKSREKLRGYGIFKTHRLEPHLYAAVHVEALDINKKFVLGSADGMQAIKWEDNSWYIGFKPGKAPVALPFKATAPQADELRELIKLASLLAAQEAGLSN